MSLQGWTSAPRRRSGIELWCCGWIFSPSRHVIDWFFPAAASTKCPAWVSQLLRGDSCMRRTWVETFLVEKTTVWFEAEWPWGNGKSLGNNREHKGPRLVLADDADDALLLFFVVGFVFLFGVLFFTAVYTFQVDPGFHTIYDAIRFLQRRKSPSLTISTHEHWRIVFVKTWWLTEQRMTCDLWPVSWRDEPITRLKLKGRKRRVP